MPIDGCNRSFGELAREVLPDYMGQLRERMTVPIPLSNFVTKGIGLATLQRRYGSGRDPSGCYVLIDKNRPVYVGISKRVSSRLMEHVRGDDHLTATLAYRIAAVRHPHDGTATSAMKDPVFRFHFDKARTNLRALDAAFVEISNPLELYQFEVYCAMELDTGFAVGGWNGFETH